MTVSPPPALKVFLCHSSEDCAVSQRIYKHLMESGYNVWLDKERLLPGQDWNLEIQKELRRTDAGSTAVKSG
jgi:hypothetical protein